MSDDREFTIEGGDCSKIRLDGDEHGDERLEEYGTDPNEEEFPIR